MEFSLANDYNYIQIQLPEMKKVYKKKSSEENVEGNRGENKFKTICMYRAYQ